MEWSNHMNNIMKHKSVQLNLNSRHPYRHQKILKNKIFYLEQETTALKSQNDEMKELLTTIVSSLKLGHKQLAQRRPIPTSNNIDIKHKNMIYNAENNINPAKTVNEKIVLKSLKDLTNEESRNRESIFNLNNQMNNFDKLHMSMLELLENVETIEGNIKVNFPEFRREISKLEIQITDALEQITELREDLKLTKNTVKIFDNRISKLNDTYGNVTRDLTSQQHSKIQSGQHDHKSKHSKAKTVDFPVELYEAYYKMMIQNVPHFLRYESFANFLPSDCGLVQNAHGVHYIAYANPNNIKTVYCANDWTVVQRRIDGSVDFNRDWMEYANGFGDPLGEYWIGNNYLHYMTKNRQAKLEINIVDIYGEYWQAAYDSVFVANYSQGYKLFVDNYRGNASDALKYHNNMEFSTSDNDRDISSTHCASNYEGGWWFSRCQQANLNGKYSLGLTWFDSNRNEWIAVARSEIRIKNTGNHKSGLDTPN